MTTTFTPSEVEYLTGQMLARLATVRSDGSLQNNPVGFVVDGDSIVIGGFDISWGLNEVAAPSTVEAR